MSVLFADNLNDISPFAPLGYRNVKWQGDPPTANPRNISAYGPNIGGTDERTTISETISIASQGQLVTFSNYSSIAVTLDSTVYNQFFCAVQVNDMGTATFTPSTGLINGAASASISGGSNLGGWLFFDGTDWWMLTGGGGGGGAVTSVFGRTGAVVAIAGDYGPTTGGTGQTSWAKGDLLVGSGVNTLAKLAVGSDGKVLTANSAAPDGIDWETPASAPVSSVFGRTGAVVAVAGDYDVTKGGTGQTGSAKGDIVIGSGTNTNARLSVGSDGKVLTANSAAPDGVDWETPASALVSSVFGRTGAVVAVAGDYGVTLGGTGQTGSTKGDIVVGSGTNTNARLSVGADKTILMADSAQTDGIAWKTARGNTFVPQLADSTTNPTNGNLASFDANGNVKDSGVSAASISTLTPFGETLSVGTGTSFTLSHTPNPTSFLQVTKNGLVLQQGVGNDYTLSGTTGTLAVAGLSSDIFQAFYMY